MVGCRTYGLTKEPNYLALETGRGIKGVWIPAAPNLIVGDVKEWAVAAKVESIRIPGYWLEQKGTKLPIGAPPRPGEKVLLNIHGGAFACQSAHPGDLISSVPRGILQYSGPSVVRALCVEYRTSKRPEDGPPNPFPAALLDVIAAFNYLVNDVGFAPEDVIAVGDSAGGNLAAGLARYLVENQGIAGLPSPPGALILCSPWVYLGPDPTEPTSSIYTNAATDFISGTNARATQQAVTNYVGPHGQAAALKNRYISPASPDPEMHAVSFAGYPRTFILNAGAEILRDQIFTLAERMKAQLGEKVTYFEVPDVWHDFLVVPLVGPERAETSKTIGKWIREETI